MTTLHIADEARFHRTLDFMSYKELAALKFHIIGAGAIGSNAALYLAKMGARQIVIHDPDTFEEANLPLQICRIEDLGKKKVEAVADIIKQFEGIEIETNPDLFDGDVEPGSIIIAGVDSMKSRKEIWKMVKAQPIQMLIDGRMGLTSMNIYTVDPVEPEAVRYYEATLWDDSDVAPVRCTAKATLFTAGTISSVICSIVSKIVRGEKIPLEVQIDMKEFYMKVIGPNGKPLSETTFIE